MKSKHWLAFFVICGLANIVGEALSNQLLTHFSKPLLMLTLGGYAFFKARENAIAMPKALIGALLFSFLGDVILMFASGNETYFLLGLVAFLIGHIFYISLNLRGRPKFRFDIEAIIFMSPIIIFTGTMLKKIADTAPGMIAPVMLYSIILCALFYTGLVAQSVRPKKQGLVLMLGISLFIISDSLIALNRFIAPFEGAGLAIMSTYILAQYLLVVANLHRPNHKIIPPSIT